MMTVRHFVSTALLGLLGLFCGVAAAAPALRVQVDQHGDFVLLGNTLGHDCAPGVPPPVVGTVGACGSNTPDSSPDVYWRSDAPLPGEAQADIQFTAPQARSTAVLNLPADATVTHAYLYWSATLTAPGSDTTATLSRPGVFSTEVTAGQTYQSVQGGIPTYQSVADVTALVQANGAGPYNIANVNIRPIVNLSQETMFAAWWMVVFYERAADPLRTLTLSDGHDPVVNGGPQTFALGGFLVPQTGGAGRLGVVALEGDNALAGDALRFNGTTLSNALNPANNFFNGSRTKAGVAVSVAGDLPQLSGAPQSMSGIDIDEIDVTPLLVPGATSATLTALSTNDVFYLASFVTAINTLSPDFATSQMAAVDLNGGSLLPGDVVEYSVSLVNTGNESGVQTRLTNVLPAGLQYVPGSLSITSGPNAGAKTDAAGDDQAEFDAAGNTVTLRLGTGANGTAGGELPVGASTTARFRAVVQADCGETRAIASQATIAYVGQLSGVEHSDVTDGNGAAAGSPPTVVTVDSDCLDVTVAGLGGSVTSSPAGIDCGTDCTGAYAPGSDVTLTAVAEANADFLGWSGDLGGTAASAVLTMDADKSVTATFALRQAITAFAATPAAPVFAPGGTFSVSATGGASGEPVVFGSATPGACSVTGNTVSILAAGLCTVTADQVGNANYSAAPQAVLDVSIAQATQAISAFASTPAAPQFSVGGTFSVSATGGASGLPVVFGSATPAVCSVAGNIVTMQTAGLCTLTADQAGNTNYSAAPQATLDVPLAQLAQTITNFAATPAAPVFIEGGSFVVSADGGDSGQPVVFASTTPAVCSVAGSTVSILAAGSCGLTANQAGNTNYAAAPQVTLGVSIGQATQAIVDFVATPAAPVFAIDGTFAVSATGGASGEPVVFASSSPLVCGVIGNSVTMLAAGTCSLTANQAGNTNFSAAPQATLDVTIAPAAQAIGGFVATPAAPVFSVGGTFVVSAQGGASGQPVVFASLTPAVCSVVGNTVAVLAAGVCSLSADQAGDAGHSAAPQVVFDVAIAQAAQVIDTFVATPAAPDFVPGGTFTLSANGGASGLPIVFGSTTPAVCTVSGNTVTMLAAGLCTLTADQAGNGNYAAATQVLLHVTLGQIAQAITDFVATPASPTYSAGGSFVVSASGGASGQPVVFASTTPAVCSIGGVTVTMLGAGTCSIVANQAGDANHAPAPQVQLDVLIAQATQSIAGFVATPAVPAFDVGGTFVVSAQGGASGQPVVFGSNSPAVCTVAGSTVTMLAPGECVLTGDQAGDANHAAATQATLMVALGVEAQTITAFVASPSNPVFVPQGTFTVSATGGDSGQPVLFASTTPAVCSVGGNVVTMLAAGECSITATQAGAPGFAAATPAVLTVTISGGAGGGVANEPAVIPVSSPWALGLLALLLGIFATRATPGARLPRSIGRIQ